jgi:hypothetical protein
MLSILSAILKAKGRGCGIYTGDYLGSSPNATSGMAGKGGEAMVR